jgi:hypothetical protein
VGLIGGETIGTVTLVSAGTPASANVGNYPIVASDARGGTFTPGNYIISYANGVLTVIPIALTVTANNASKPFGQTAALPGTAFTTSGMVNGDTVGSVTEVSPGTVATASVAGSPYVITPSNATGGTFVPGNYTIAYVNGMLTVIPVPLTITANDVSKSYGTAITLPVTAFTSTGLANGDTVTSVTEISPGTVATAPVAGSPYVITPSGATGSFVPTNYTIAYVNGVLTVIPVPLTITANDASKSYGTAITLPVTAFTSTGLVNGETVTSVTEISPGTVATAPVAGSPYVITPSGATGSFVPTNYTIAYVNGALTVTPVVDLPPVVEPPVVVPPGAPVVVVPGVASTLLPPQLQTLAPPILPAPVVVANNVVLDELIPPVEGVTGAVGNVVDEKYPLVAPHRPRKQDRN